MKISLDWLKEYIDIETDAESLGRLLTNTGLEVEGIYTFEEIKGNLRGLLIGEVLICEKHPDADRLSVATVDAGTEKPLSIVCGAPNVATGQKVAVAPVGTTLHHISGETLELKKTKIRGEVSEGMICAEDEIGVSEDHSGIAVLDTELPNGTLLENYYKPFHDKVFEIGLTPNRGDAASHIGVARDIHAVTGTPLRLPETNTFKADNHDLPIEVIVENTEACPRYSGLTIAGITIAESPRWLKNRLRSIGLAPINNVVDITNFILHEMGQPLHAFDADKIAGNKVIVKTMQEGSSFTTLDAIDRKLKDHDLMICNVEEGMCIAGVFGGIRSGITEKTKNIFLESAYFSPDYIRRTAQYHELKTDASFRFERGTNPEITVTALKRAALLIRELAGGSISSDVIDIYPEKIRDFEVPVKFRHIDRLIGKAIPREKVLTILKALDIKAAGETEEGFTALVPPYRIDVLREADVIEEILRIYGYDNIEIPEQIGSKYLADFPVKDTTRLQEKISDLLASIGFIEILTNSLTTPFYTDKISAARQGDDVEIVNKLSEELGVMRQSLIFSGLEVIAYNISHKQKNLKLFELGKTYAKDGGNFLESNQLALFMSGDAEEENWLRPSRKVEFHDLYEVIQKILHKFNNHEYQLDFAGNDIFRESVDLSIKGKKLVSLGWLAGNVCSTAGLKQDVLFSIFDWDYFIRLTSTDVIIEPVSKYPEVRRDLSLVIDQSVTFIDILKITRSKDNKLIRRINVFDYYEGDKIGKNQKAYAMSFILQDKTKTLTDKVIDKTMNQLIRNFENELGAIIRK